MSLINEALKRTRDASYQTADARTLTVDQYRIAHGTQTTSPGLRLGITLTVVIALALAVGMAALFSGHSLLPRQKGSEQLTPVSTVHRPTVSPPSAPVLSTPGAENSQIKDSPTQVQPDGAPAKKAAAPEEAAEAALVAKLLAKIKAEQTTTTAPTPAPSAPEPPKLVLQGIMSEGNSREAMIDGCNVHDGDEIEGAHVVAIEARSVKLRFGDRDVFLRMP
jgi:hypothetical protein